MMERSDSKMGLTVFLTAIAIALAAMFFAVFGAFGLFFFGMTVPVCLFLLWLSRDVESWEDKWAPIREEQREPAPRPAVSRA